MQLWGGGHISVLPAPRLSGTLLHSAAERVGINGHAGGQLRLLWSQKPKSSRVDLFFGQQAPMRGTPYPTPSRLQRCQVAGVTAALDSAVSVLQKKFGQGSKWRLKSSPCPLASLPRARCQEKGARFPYSKLLAEPAPTQRGTFF